MPPWGPSSAASRSRSGSIRAGARADVDDSSWTDLPPALFKVLEDAGVPSSVTNLRFSEAFLLPGDRVTVMGAVAVELHPAGEPRLREPPMRRRIIGTDRTPVILRDAVED